MIAEMLGFVNQIITSSGVLALLVLVVVSGPVFAQSSAEPRAYVGAGFTVAWQSEESVDFHYLRDSTVGGASAGLHVVAGIHIAPSFSLGGEWSKTGSVSGTRSSTRCRRRSLAACRRRRPT